MAYYYIPLRSFLTSHGRLQGFNFVSQQHYLIARTIPGSNGSFTFLKATYNEQPGKEAPGNGEAAAGKFEKFSGYMVLDNFSGKALYRYRNGERLTSSKQPSTDDDNYARWVCDQECTWFSYCTGADIGGGNYSVTTTYGYAGSGCDYPVASLPQCGFAGAQPVPWALTSSADINCVYIDDGTGDPGLPPDGSGGGGDQPNIWITDIINNFTNPCFGEVLRDIMDGKLQNAIVNILCTLYSNTDILSLQFSNADIGDYSLDGITRMQSSGSFVVANITLNDSALYNASQEYIAATIIHEVLHAYMNYKGGVQPIIEHEDMALFYQDVMMDALLEMYPTLERWQAEALTWGGLEKTYAYTSFRGRWPRIALQEKQFETDNKSGAAGTPCE